MLEFFQRRPAQFLQLGGVGAIGIGLAVFVSVEFGHCGSGRRLRRREVFLGVRVDQAVDDFVDAHGLGADLVGCSQDLGDGGRAGGDRHDHVLEAIFDPLGDLDLALAGEQLDRAHLAHVHAHGVSGAAKLGIDRRQRRLGFFLGVFVGGDNRGVVIDQQGFSIGGALIDRDAHVAEGGDDRINGFGIDQVFGQMVVDLGVGQETPFLAELDQQLELVALGLEFFFGAAQVMGERVPDQGLFLGALVASPDLGRGRRRNGFDGLDFTAVAIFEGIGRVADQVEIGIVSGRTCLGFGTFGGCLCSRCSHLGRSAFAHRLG